MSSGQSDALERFVRDIAERGCRVRWGGGRRDWTCLDEQESARAAQQSGTQPTDGPRWGSEGATGAWRDRIAAGERLCRGCRAHRALEGIYVPPGDCSEAR